MQAQPTIDTRSDVRKEEASPTRFFERIVSGSGVPGVCVAIKRAGKEGCIVMGTAAAGDPSPLSAHSRFQIGCLGTTLLCTAAIELEESGHLDLDASIATYLPELAGDQKGERILVRHLMSHTAGYAGFDVVDAETATLTWEPFIERIRKTPQLFEPGAVFNYEQSVGALLAEIVTRAAHRPSHEVIDDLLLGPCRRHAASAEPQCDAIGHIPDVAARKFVRARGDLTPSGVWQPSVSSARLSAGELLTLADLLMTGELDGANGKQRVLSPRTTQRMAERAVEVPRLVGGKLSHCLPIGFGLGLAEFRGGARGSDGTSEGQVVAFRFQREQALAVAVALNAQAVPLRHMLIDAIVAPRGGASDAAPRPFDIDLSALPGHFVGPGGCEAWIESRGHTVDILVRHANGASLSMAASLDGDGRLDVKGAQFSAGVAFFREPGSAAVCMMFGLNALKQVEPARGDRV